MDGYIAQTPRYRRLLCEEAQERLNLPAASLEKDFWVCWILRELFGIPEWREALTFKGGTSLSKCWNYINRFSEDIDLVIGKDHLGFGGEDSPECADSKKQRKKRLDALKHAAQERIKSSLLPALEERIEPALSGGEKWEVVFAPEEEDPDRQTLLFRYPSSLENSKAYIRPVVKIEMGARSDNEPSEDKEVHPYIFDVFPDILGNSRFSVRVLAAERTFWEKVMLLHEENFRPLVAKRRPARLARHYYDLWCLITKGIAEAALDREDICVRAARHREIFFNRSWMDYGTLTRKKLRMMPSPDREAEWRRDYQAMSGEMFFGYVPEFSEVLSELKVFQKRLNTLIDN